MNDGKLVVISAPSGGGKTTIAHAILVSHPELEFSVSATTRPMRQNEVQGRDYFFMTHDEFRRRIAAGEFVEWEEIYGNLYGTLKDVIDSARKAHRPVLFDVDVKGGLSIKRMYPEALLVFIRPPSTSVLNERLIKRKTEDTPAIARRMERVPMEMDLGEEFEYRIVNDDIDRTVAEVNRIVEEYLTH